MNPTYGDKDDYLNLEVAAPTSGCGVGVECVSSRKTLANLKKSTIIVVFKLINWNTSSN